MIFLWGNEQERIIRTNFSVGNKLVVSGGPRLDIWRPEFVSLYQSKISELQKRYGKYIFFPTNWGFYPALKQNGLDPHTIYPKNLLSHIRSAFITLINELASALPNRTLIVRPHPVDMPEYWEKVAKTFPKNVKVIYEGAISPWVHAAHAVVHNNCTTGIEGWMGNVSVFAYYPIFKDFKEYRYYTMPINELAVVCRTANELITKVSKSFLDSKTVSSDTQSNKVKKFVHIEKERYASDNIISKIQELNITEESYEIPNFDSVKKLRALWGSLKWLARDYLGKSGMYTHSYTRQKNSGLEIDEITDLLQRFAPIVGIDENFFQVREVDKDTFCIFGKEKVTQQK